MCVDSLIYFIQLQHTARCWRSSVQAASRHPSLPLLTSPGVQCAHLLHYSVDAFLSLAPLLWRKRKWKEICFEYTSPPPPHARVPADGLPCPASRTDNHVLHPLHSVFSPLSQLPVSPPSPPAVLYSPPSPPISHHFLYL